MRMCPCKGDVLLIISSILAAQASKALKYSMSDSSVPRQCIQDKVDESVIWIISIGDNESPRIDSLPKTSPNLVQASIAIQP